MNATIKIITIILQVNACIPSLNLESNGEKQEDAGYIKVKKAFKNNYPNAMLSITDKGVKVFESYVNSLKK